MRGRGLKQDKRYLIVREYRSPLMRGRGLKPITAESLLDTLQVAPHAGAWIETSIRVASGYPSLVAPHAGAWIET